MTIGTTDDPIPLKMPVITSIRPQRKYGRQTKDSLSIPSAMAFGRIGYINFKQLGRSKIHRDTADYSGNGHRTKGDTHYLFYAVEFLCTVVSSDKIEGGLMKAVHCQVDKAL